MQITKYLRPVILGIILCASHSRTFSIINGYSAPLEVYKLLEHHDDAGPGINRTLRSLQCKHEWISHLTFTSRIVIFHWTKRNKVFFSKVFWILLSSWLVLLVCQVLFCVWEANGIDTHHRFSCLTSSAKYGGSMMDSAVFFHSHLTVHLEALQHHLHTSTRRTKHPKNNL